MFLPGDLLEMAGNDFLIFPDRGSHFELFKNRDWGAIDDYWLSITKSGIVPDWISNPPHSYGVTDLKAVHECGRDEIALFGKNIARMTYAVRVGYAGSHYQVRFTAPRFWCSDRDRLVGISVSRTKASIHSNSGG
jgi:hypothetical protein